MKACELRRAKSRTKKSISHPALIRSFTRRVPSGSGETMGRGWVSLKVHQTTKQSEQSETGFYKCGKLPQIIFILPSAQSQQHELSEVEIFFA